MFVGKNAFDVCYTISIGHPSCVANDVDAVHLYALPALVVAAISEQKPTKKTIVLRSSDGRQIPQCWLIFGIVCNIFGGADVHNPAKQKMIDNNKSIWHKFYGEQRLTKQTRV